MRLRTSALPAAFAVISAAPLASSASATPAPSAPPDEGAWAWASEAASPRPLGAGALADREAELQRMCGRGDVGLRAVAALLVERRLRELAPLEADAVAQLQRVAGEPHVWARTWVISGRALDHDATVEKLAAWGRTFREPGERRCGVATGYGPEGTEVVAAIALDAEADLAPVPIRTRVGAWIPIDARLLVPASGARVLVLGPLGRPRTVPTHLEGGRVRAQLTLDQPGAFRVQVVADLATGPRPVLEVELFADATPWTRSPDLRAPGEGAAAVQTNASNGGASSDRATMLAIISALRASEQLCPLTPDARLDAVATAHAGRMRQARAVAHDVGDGDPTERFAAAGVSLQALGENVAHAASLPLAHRALYASPSHRANLLATGFDHVGVGVLRDPDGSVWVTEEFVGGAR